MSLQSRLGKFTGGLFKLTPDLLAWKERLVERILRTHLKLPPEVYRMQQITFTGDTIKAVLELKGEDKPVTVEAKVQFPADQPAKLVITALSVDRPWMDALAQMALRLNEGRLATDVPEFVRGIVSGVLR